MNARSQIPFDFHPGLTQKFRGLEDCVHNSVYTSRRGLEGVASDIDMGSTELGRRLCAHLAAREGEANNRPLRVCDLVQIIESTENYDPVFWLIERFLHDPSIKRDRALHQLAGLLPQLQTLVEQAGLNLPAGKKGRRDA